MTGFSVDKSGNARLALEDVYRDYGLSGIDDERLLSQMLPDLLAGAPREASLLQAAAAAQVGRLLTERIDASIPAEAAVRDVAAILTERTAFDANACLWVVTEYAHAIGHPVAVMPVPGTVIDPIGTPIVVPPVPDTAPGPVPLPTPGPLPAPGPASGDPQYTPGRYTPRVPQYGEDLTRTDSGTTNMVYLPPRPNWTLRIVGIAAVVVVLIVGTVIVVNAWPSPASCQGASCIAGPTTNTSVPVTPTTTPPTTPTVTPTPSPIVTVTVGPTIVPALRTLLPTDIVVSSCATNGDRALLPKLTNVVSSYTCTENSASLLTGMRVWGYQFRDESSFEASVDEFNSYLNFHPDTAGSACPPSSSSPNGYTTWHRNDNSDVVLGHLECYTGTDKSHVYIWTDFNEYTIMVTATTTSQSFKSLESWWENHNGNSRNA